MTVGGLIPSQTYKDLVACEDNTAVKRNTFTFYKSTGTFYYVYENVVS